jgi:hypothetical protein
VYKSTNKVHYCTSDFEFVELFCTGDWKAPVCIYKFWSAVGNLHKLYDSLCRQYFLKCEYCVKEQENNKVPGTYQSCVNHAGLLQLRELGNPTYSTICKDEEGAA